MPMTLQEALVEGAPSTSVFVSREGIIINMLNGELLEKLGVFWRSEWIGNSLHECLAPHFVGGMTPEMHKKMFDAHMSNPVERRLGEGTRPFELKALDGTLYQAFISLSEPREISTGSMLKPDETIEGITAFILLWGEISE